MGSIDLNSLTENGLYSYEEPANKPEGTSGWVNVLVSRMADNALYVCQLAMASAGVFIRSCDNGSWQGWRAL